MAITLKEAQADEDCCVEEEKKVSVKDNPCRIAELRNIRVVFRGAISFFNDEYGDLTPTEKAKIFKEINDDYEVVRERLRHLLDHPDSGGYAEELEKQLKKHED